MANFVHLHTHTEYSLLDGLSKIPDLISKAKDYGMPALAITDHGVMHGVISFYSEALKAGIKPIIGCEAYVAKKSRFDKIPKVGSDANHLILLCENEKGYKNLIQLVTMAHLEGFYYKPRIDVELLAQHHQGLIALSACLQGEIPQLLLAGHDTQAREKAVFYQDLFGKGNFFIEIQKHQIEEQDQINKELIALASDLRIPLVATNDSHYINPEDAEAQEVLLCVQTQKTLAEKNRPLSMIQSPDFYLRSPAEMEILFHETPEALKNTLSIAERVDLKISTGKMIFPHFTIPEDKPAGAYFKELAFRKAKEKFKKITPEVQNRLDYEISVIDDKGYIPYFLVVSDFVNWAKEQGISVGPGRGSAAGSLVSYVLNITTINPLEYGIPFERFLNPQRPSPPDIDLDFADKRRGEVISYITQKYGKDHVAQIITFGKMEARGSIRDVGRVLGMPYSEPDKIAKMIPFGSSIEEALGTVSELKEAIREPKYKRLLDLAKKLEGVSRHASTHAAGLVISDKPLVYYVPLQKESKGEAIITQYDMYSIDLNSSDNAIGLLKIDLLGLRNLTILENAINLVNQNRKQKVDLAKIPLDDKAVYKLIAAGNTVGVFQLESAGMRRLAKDLNPNRFSDLIAMVALFRPGPMDLIPQFVAGKKNPQKIRYPHPDLKDILADTYGILLYQEQCLYVANKIAGYSMGEADQLRKAIGKKKRAIMEKEKVKFIKGALDLGYQKKIAEELWGFIERFAGYGFGKAHSASYAMIAYQTAYMKANYPVEFMCALLEAEASNKDQIAMLIAECRKMTINVLPPDINFSEIDFTIQNREIRFGLSAIKNVGEGAVGNILLARSKSGPFTSLKDFCERVDLRQINKKVLESLIRSGAFDSFGQRAAQLKALEEIMEMSHREKSRKSSGMLGLFDGLESDPSLNNFVLPRIEEVSARQKLTWERELLGFYLSEHPLLSVIKKLGERRTHSIGEIEFDHRVGMRVKLGVLVSEVRKIFTRATNHEMAFVKVEDETGTLEVIVFPKIFASTKDLWIKDQMLLITGKVDLKDEELKVIADNALKIIPEEIANQKSVVEKVFEIAVFAELDHRRFHQMYEILKKYPGEAKAILIFSDGDSQRKMELPFRVEDSPQLKQEIEVLMASVD